MQLFKPIVFLFASIFVIFFISSLEAREPLPPRFSANAYTGVYTVGLADLMVSLDGDSQHNLYADPQGAYGSDQQWVGDLGLGYRWIKNDAAILGWYLFAGHTRVENSSGFWIVSPGIEALGRCWDARINAYIPVAGRSNELGIEEFNIMNTTVFSGHTATLNTVFTNENVIQQIGNGADARVGYQFFHQVPLKGYVGAYFFTIPNTNNITGGAAGLEYWFDDNIRVFSNYSYDNYQHSNLVGGLGISFGGVRKHWADPSLSERLTDPVDRYLANLGHGSGIPSKTLLYGMGRGSSSQLISSDIAFFSLTGAPNNGGTALTLADCTFENPCGPTDFSQTGVNTLNTLLPNTNFYFNGGTYEAADGVEPLTLNNGQGVFSRTADYSAAATGAARSSFNGGFVLEGNNQLHGIILQYAPGLAQEAIFSDGGQNIQLNNIQVGIRMLPPYPIAIEFINGAMATMDQSFVYSLRALNLNDSSFTIQSSDIVVANGMDSSVAGFELLGSQMQFNNSQLLVLGDVSDEVLGIFADGTSTVSINNSDLTIQNIRVPTPSSALGLETIDSQIQMNGGSLSVIGDDTSELTSGTNIVLNGVACTLNGISLIC